MKQELLDKLKNSLPVCLTITSSTDYPNGIQREGFESISEPIAKVTGFIGHYGIVITWYYESPEDKVEVSYISPRDGEDKIIKFNELRDFLLSFQNKNT